METAVASGARDRVHILGLPVDRVDVDTAMARIAEFIRGSEPRVVVTADAAGLVLAQQDPEFAQIVRGADLVTPDSVGVLWAARRLGKPIRQRVSGVDLVDLVCAKSSELGWRVFLLGAAPGVAEMAAERLRLRHPGCNIVGTRHGFFPPESDDVVAREIAEHRPDVLFVAMGMPRQEKFIWSTRELIGAKVAMGVGGSLDVHSGRVRRAPRWVQRIGLEWLWRSLLNPRKIAKAKNLPLFLWRVLRWKG
ncbi:MAG: WecB/TagA/CpsF family glycosyltransferase [Fimbriimonadales bacterium]|nr:WecB/TagA/CpsF family glycosyltransferase [Fimbriimonadales bacterium]